MKFINSENNTN